MYTTEQGPEMLAQKNERDTHLWYERSLHMMHNWRGRRCTTHYTGWNKTRAQAPHSFIPWLEKEERQIHIFYNTCPVMFSFQNTLHCQVAQAM
jgi:hypothetical protein